VQIKEEEEEVDTAEEVADTVEENRTLLPPALTELPQRHPKPKVMPLPKLPKPRPRRPLLQSNMPDLLSTRLRSHPSSISRHHPSHPRPR